MPIPLQVTYRTIGKKKERIVEGVITPKPISVFLGFVPEIIVDMGDVIVDWKESSAGFEAVLIKLDKMADY